MLASLVLLIFFAWRQSVAFSSSHFCVIFMSFWCHFGACIFSVFFMSLWCHFSVILGTFLCHFGAFFNYFFLSFWCHFEVILVSFWSHFSVFSVVAVKWIRKWSRFATTVLVVSQNDTISQLLKLNSFKLIAAGISPQERQWLSYLASIGNRAVLEQF